MKNKFLFYGVVVLMIAFAGMVAFGSGSRAYEAAVVKESTAEGDFESVGTGYYEYTYTKDTISNAANDTLYLPSKMRPVLSDFIVTYSVTRTNISGTTNIAVKIEESTYKYSSSTPPTAGWVASLNTAGSAAATAATTATEEEIRLPNAHAVSYRCIVDGTGTQSTSYVVRVIMKKKS
jgi:hypothetical protein